MTQMATHTPGLLFFLHAIQSVLITDAFPLLILQLAGLLLSASWQSAVPQAHDMLPAQRWSHLRPLRPPLDCAETTAARWDCTAGLR